MNTIASTPQQLPALIGERTFEPADQQRFARLSSDRNPMHMDAIAARRLITGAAVVHGVHLLLTALEFGFASGAVTGAFTNVRCNFNNPVSVGDRVVFHTQAAAGGGSQINANVDALTCCQVVIVRDDASAPRSTAATSPEQTQDIQPICLRPWQSLDSPADEPPESQLHQRYILELSGDGFADAFPQCVAQFGSQATAAIASLSYMVGMVCPGLHSVFSSLRFSLSADDASAATLHFEVVKFDRRVQLFEVAFDGCIVGSLKAFRRPLPQLQPSMAALHSQVAQVEFAGSRTLVIGGSRGLGELSARLLAAGGGEVTVSYAVGQDEALALCDEINAAQPSTHDCCDTIRIDLLHDRFDALALDWSQLDTVCYFATPRIFRKKGGVFDAALFAEFTHFYVDKFYELCLVLEMHDRERKVQVLLPSTTALDERPKGMTEYVMAKAAAEVLAQDINRSFRNVSVTLARLPRLNTDQTASILQVDTVSNVDVMLPILRRFHQAHASYSQVRN